MNHYSTSKKTDFWRSIPYPATLCYILFIVFINTTIVYVPGIAAFGESFSLADVCIGIIYLLRDFTQREIKHYVIIAMLIGGGLSYVLATKELAIASIGAFAVGELIEWAIYTWAKKPLSQRLLWSSMISVPIDSSVFLILSVRFHWVPFTMMTCGKILGIFMLWASWKFRNHRNAALTSELNSSP